MKRRERIFLISLAFFMAIGLRAAPAWAGGFAVYELGTFDVGLAGAGWAARAQDASTLYTESVSPKAVTHCPHFS